MSMLPTMAGTIDRRILVNYRVDPDVAARALPAPFRPNTTFGPAIVGICLIRLSGLRPLGLPRAFGMTTENAAHRFAVMSDALDGPEHGVYIPRRDTSSRLTQLVGGRLFPGEHHPAKFDVSETDSRFNLTLQSTDGHGTRGRRLGGHPPLAVTSVESSFFADESRFPGGSVHFDSALLMQNLRATWLPRPPLHGHAGPTRPMTLVGVE